MYRTNAPPPPPSVTEGGGGLPRAHAYDVVCPLWLLAVFRAPFLKKTGLSNCSAATAAIRRREYRKKIKVETSDGIKNCMRVRTKKVGSTSLSSFAVVIIMRRGSARICACTDGTLPGLAVAIVAARAARFFPERMDLERRLECVRF